MQNNSEVINQAILHTKSYAGEFALNEIPDPIEISQLIELSTAVNEEFQREYKEFAKSISALRFSQPRSLKVSDILGDWKAYQEWTSLSLLRKFLFRRKHMERNGFLAFMLECS